MLELDTIYTRGGNTRFFLLIKYGWIMYICAALVGVLMWQINFGYLEPYALELLADFPDLYIDITMLTEWLGILAFGFVLIGYLRGNLMFRHYKFVLDNHAFHLRRGIFMIKETTIPYHQVSNVHIIRPYHYRMLGLAQVDIATASDRRMHHNKVRDCLIPVIDYSLARILSKQLIGYADQVKDGGEIEDIEYDYESTEEEQFEHELNSKIRQ